jgi:hypothetical protein
MKTNFKKYKLESKLMSTKNINFQQRKKNLNIFPNSKKAQDSNSKYQKRKSENKRKTIVAKRKEK